MEWMMGQILEYITILAVWRVPWKCKQKNEVKPLSFVYDPRRLTTNNSKHLFSFFVKLIYLHLSQKVQEVQRDVHFSGEQLPISGAGFTTGLVLCKPLRNVDVSISGVKSIRIIFDMFDPYSLYKKRNSGLETTSIYFCLILSIHTPQIPFMKPTAPSNLHKRWAANGIAQLS